MVGIGGLAADCPYPFGHAGLLIIPQGFPMGPTQLSLSKHVVGSQRDQEFPAI